jgi:CHAT domain-containing protein/tetratricopeptide (TPR) repeat protein
MPRFRVFISLVVPVSFMMLLPPVSRAQEDPNAPEALKKKADGYYQRGKYDSATIYLQEAIGIIELTQSPGGMFYAGLLYKAGNCCLIRGEEGKAMDHYRKGLSYAGKNTGLAASLNMNLGDIYFLREDYGEAINHYKRAILISSGGRLGDVARARILMNLGSSYLEMNDPQQALSYYQKARDLYDEGLIRDPASEGRLFIDLGSGYFSLNDYENALKYFLDARSSLESSRSPQRERLLLDRNIALTYGKSGHLDSCLTILGSVIARMVPETGYDSLELSTVYRLAGACLRENERWMESLNYHDLSVKYIPFRGENGDISGAEINSFPGMIGLFRTLCERARALYLYGSRFPAEKDCLEQGLSDTKRALDLLDRVDLGFREEGSGLVFNEPLKTLVSGAMNAIWTLSPQLTGEDRESLFALSERSRCRVMQGSIQRRKAMHGSGIPVSLLEKAGTIDDELAALEAGTFREDLLMTEPGMKRAKDVLARISGLRMQRDSLEGQLEKEHPRYAAMKKAHPLPGTADIISGLGQDECLIEYFLEDTTLYIFTLSKEGFFMVRKTVPADLAVDAGKYYSLIASADVREFCNLSHLLYSNLITPVAGRFGNKPKLIIIPDESLQMVPFETLVTDTADLGSPSGHHYLIMDFGISYRLSAYRNVLTGAGDLALTGKCNFTGYAPAFTGAFNTLPAAAEEVSAIAGLFRARGLKSLQRTGREATKADFSKNSGGYSFVHLATHSQIDMQHPERSGLLFSEDSLHAGTVDPGCCTLYLNEIRRLEPGRTGLIVLSACSTGKGKAVRSEGVLSLTRAFITAGYPAVIQSLWNITDRNTRDFMTGFYREMLDGKDAASALRTIKIKMIPNRATALPVLWAPFVLLEN